MLVYIDPSDYDRLASCDDSEAIAWVDEIADYFDDGCRNELGHKCDCHVCEG